MNYCKCHISKSIKARNWKLGQLIGDDNRIGGKNCKKNHTIFFQLLPFLKFCNMCDMSKSIIARGLKLLSANRVQLVDYLMKIKKKHMLIFLSYCHFEYLETAIL